MLGHSQTKRKAQKSVKIIANTIHQQQNFNKNDSETRGLRWEFGLYTAYLLPGSIFSEIGQGYNARRTEAKSASKKLGFVDNTVLSRETLVFAVFLRIVFAIEGR